MSLENNIFYQYGKLHNTDKVTHHKYHNIYPRYIEQYYDTDGGILEVGLAGQCSLRTWLDVFPNMHVYVFEKDCTDSSTDRYSIIQCDQSSAESLQKAVKKCKHPIYFINDDGSHHPEHQLLTFNALFPTLEVGGVYIIEDIETSYWTRGQNYGYDFPFGIGHPDSIVEVFKKVADSVNYEFSRFDDSTVQHVHEIQSITFAKNCIVIVKGPLEDVKPVNEYRFADHL